MGTATDTKEQIAARQPGLMRAVVQSGYGSADVLGVEDIEQPAIDRDEVLVQVHAAGVDRGTWHLLTGRPYLIRVMGFGLRAPKSPVPGLDVSGTVAAVGADVTRFAVGDPVFGIAKGSFAQYAPAEEDKLAIKPAGVSVEQASVTAVSGLTALQALRDVAGVKPGHEVLIVGASGGVGTFAVQIAKSLGARVSGVGSSGKLELIRSLGADRVIDYTRDDFADGARRYDVILDIGGSSSLRRLRRALTKTGTLVIVGGEGGRWFGGIDRPLRGLALSPFVSQKLTTFISKEKSPGDLEYLAELIAAGELTPAIDTIYPLSEVAEAIRHLEAGRAKGKLAIVP